MTGLEAIESRAHDEGPILLSLVVPVYNESESVGPFLDRVIETFGDMKEIDLEVIFINDGSSDGTLERLLDLQRRNSFVRIADLSRNFGKEAALTAGLNIAK